MKPMYNDHDADDMKRKPAMRGEKKKTGMRMAKMGRKKMPMEGRPMKGPSMPAMPRPRGAA